MMRSSPVFFAGAVLLASACMEDWAELDEAHVELCRSLMHPATCAPVEAPALGVFAHPGCSVGIIAVPQDGSDGFVGIERCTPEYCDYSETAAYVPPTGKALAINEFIGIDDRGVLVGGRETISLRLWGLGRELAFAIRGDTGCYAATPHDSLELQRVDSGDVGPGVDLEIAFESPDAGNVPVLFEVFGHSRVAPLGFRARNFGQAADMRRYLTGEESPGSCESGGPLGARFAQMYQLGEREPVGLTACGNWQ